MVRFSLVLTLALLTLAGPATAQPTGFPTPPAEPSAVSTDPNGTRLFLSPTARTMTKGQGRFSDYMVFFPSVAYGFTDWLDASVGVSIIPGSSGQLVTANVKANVLRRDGVDVAVGNLLLTTVGEDVGSGFGGSVYGLATFGSARRAVTLGAYVGYGGGSFEETTCFEDICETESNFELGFADGVVALVGGELQVAKTVKLISENYVAFSDGESGGIVSGGVRFFGERLAADFALFRPIGVGTDIDGFPFFPYVGFAYNF